ncbi:MAG TPA: hypothetical protein VLQ45_19620 [Thermoanaerobaculia bacterium]|nr:hypothetical protein [Thermoanaerobaculia bacterium]
MSMADVLDCIENQFIPGLPGLRTARPDARDFLGRIKGALLRALQRVDDLPRDHPVWRYLAVQTVNPYRLTEHCHRLLRDNPLDKDSLWALVAVNLANGSDRFPEDSWESLLLAEESFDPDWLIFAGLLWSTAVGDESVEELTQFLLRNGLCEKVMPILRSLESGENAYAHVALDEFYVHEHVIDWARQVKECCEEARS